MADFSRALNEEVITLAKFLGVSPAELMREPYWSYLESLDAARSLQRKENEAAKKARKR